MIALGIAAAIQLAPGCRVVGHALRCVLSAPLPPKPSAAPIAAGQAAPDRGNRSQPSSQPTRVSRPRPAKPASHATTPADIDRHVGSLTAIADCTGARTYLISIDRVADAQRTFDRCIGIAPAGPDVATFPSATPPPNPAGP